MAKKKVAAKKAKKPVSGPLKEAMNKSQLFAYLAETAEISKKDVARVFEAYTDVVGRHIKKNGVGEFKMPGLFKISVVHKPARKARKGINPFTGEETMFKAKPASNAVKIRPLKSLKEMVR